MIDERNWKFAALSTVSGLTFLSSVIGALRSRLIPSKVCAEFQERLMRYALARRALLPGLGVHTYVQPFDRLSYPLL